VDLREEDPLEDNKSDQGRHYETFFIRKFLSLKMWDNCKFRCEES